MPDIDTWQPGVPLFRPNNQWQLQYMIALKEEHEWFEGAARWSPDKGWRGAFNDD